MMQGKIADDAGENDGNDAEENRENAIDTGMSGTG